MPIFSLNGNNKPPIDFHKFVIEVLKVMSKKGYYFKDKKNMEYIDWVKENPNEFTYNAMIDGTRSLTLTNTALKLVGQVSGVATYAATTAKDMNDNLRFKQAIDHDLDSISFLKQKDNLINLYPHYKYSGNKKYIYTVEYNYNSLGIYLVFRCIDKNSIQSKLIKEGGNIYMPIHNKRQGYNYKDIFVTNESTTQIKAGEFYKERSDVERIFSENFDMSDSATRRTLMAMNEAGHNSVLTTLTSKLYDHIIKKTYDIDFGGIPDTKGDITKLPEYEDIIDAITVMRDLLKEYHQDTAPVDTLSTALANIKTRKDLFTKAFHYDCEMPIVMYNTMTLAIIDSIGYLISGCIEFVKTPRDESFKISLDKVAYAKTKSHLLFTSLDKFNHACEKGDFDKAMRSIIDQRVRKFTGVVVGALVGTIAGILLIMVLIPILRELVYVFYYSRVRITDFLEVQADLLQMNAYNVEHNNTIDNDKKNEIVKRQTDIVSKFRSTAEKITIDSKRTDVNASKELQSSNKKYKVDDIDNEIKLVEPEEDSGSALF